jgi:hypothetical protein
MMQDFLTKAGRMAKDVAGMAADKTGEVVETAKVKAKIKSAKDEIEVYQQKIGAYYFDKHLSKDKVDPEVIGYCEKINDQMRMIDDLEEQLKFIKE